MAIDQLGKTLEQIVAVLRARRGLGVILHAEHRPAFRRDAFVTIVEQADVRDFHVVGQTVGVDNKAVVLAGDLDLARHQVLDLSLIHI